MKDNIPWMLERAHAKNVTAHSKENDGKMDFEIGLSTTDSAVIFLLKNIKLTLTLE